MHTQAGLVRSACGLLYSSLTVTVVMLVVTGAGDASDLPMYQAAIAAIAGRRFAIAGR